ncbi:MAG: DinB family protein [Terriglobales bacterium]
MKIQLWKFYAVLCFVVGLALVSIAQTEASPAPTTLTPQERDAALRSLQATHDAFLKSIAGLSEKQWRFKPGPDRWSVAEVSEHIAISESMLFGMIQSKIMTSPADPAKRAEVAAKDEIILTKIPDRSHKAQAPEFLKPTNRWATQAELTKAFEDSRRATMDYVRTTNDDLRDHFGPHPVLGPLDAYQWILLISAHSERHTKQIEEVKADPNFPKE